MTQMTDKEVISQLEGDILQLRAQVLKLQLGYHATAAGHAKEIMPYLNLELQQLQQAIAKREKP